MSATIDERVVEMRFDNKHFESNVATSMSTLDKLKQKLNLSGASKGLEDINNASKKVNMSGLGGAVESVSAKFSAMQVIGITALANITNQAVNAGKRIAAALTIDPIKSGFQEYETQINAVQTILANTSAKGTTIDDVNAALDELNKYADLTIYNFTEMTRNIGTFTSAGIDLETSVNAIQGIANLAAVSGSTSQQASTAMYQLSQALASGTVKLMDWNSVVNAGMGGEVFQNALKKTSELLGTGAEAAIAAEGSFRESLKTGWLTSEVLTETLKKFTTSGAAEYVAEFTGLSKELVDTTLESTDAWGDETDAIDKAAEALANKSGKNKDEIKSVLEMAKTAQDAATKVKTFTQLFDVLKEAAQSGWSQTWRIIIGDFEEAKALITPLSDILTGFINRMSDWRNNILEGALTNKFSASWASILEKLNSAGLVKIDGITKPFKKIVDIIDGIDGITEIFDRISDGVNGVTGSFKTAIGTVEYFQDVVDRVWRGEFNRNGDNPDRRDLLTEAGYNYKVVQDLVNLGAGYKLTMDDIVASHKKYGAALQTTAGDTKNIIATTNAAIGSVEYFQDVVDKVWRGEYNHNGDNPDRRDLLTAAGYDYRVVQDLVNLGPDYKLTMDDIIASHQKYGLTLQTTADDTKNVTVATNDSTKSTIGARVAIGELTDEQLKQAGLTEDEISLYRALEKEAKRLGISVSELAEMMSTIDGRTLLIDSFKNIGSSIIGVGKAIKNAWVDIFNPPGIAELSVKLYGAIVSLNRFSEKIRLTDKDTGELNETGKKLQRTFKGIFAILDIVTTILGGGLKIAFKVLSEILSAFDLNILDVTANIGDALVAFRDWLLEGNALAKGFDWLISKLPIVVDKFKEWFNTFKETPAVQKLVNAINAIGDAFSKLTSGEIDISEFARLLGENLAKALKSIPEIAIQIGKDFIAGFQNGIGDKISNVINNVIEFCINFVDAFKEALGVHSPSWKAYDTAVDFFQGFINGVKEMLKPVLDVLKKIGEGIVKVFKSLWDFITDENGNIEWGKLFVGGAVVSMIWVLKQLATAFNGIANAIGGIDDLIRNTGKVLKSFSKVLNGIAWDFKAKALLKMSIAIGVLVSAIWVLTQIDDIGKLWNAVGVIAALALILIGLSIAMDKLSAASVKVGKNGASIDGIKTGLLQIGIAIALLGLTVKMIGDMDPDKAAQGFKGLAAIAVGMIAFLAIMGGISRYSNDISGIGGMMIKLSIAMMLMVVVCKLASKLSGEEMLKGAAFATGFAIFVIAITKVAKSAGNNVSKVGGMVIKLSIAMLLMIGVCKLASMLSDKEMLKGAAFATGFVLFVGALVSVTKIGKKQQLAKISGLVLSASFSLLLMVGICKLVGLLSVEEMLKGAAFVAGFVVLLKILTSILKIGDKEKMASLAGTILAISAAIAILAGVAILLSFMDIGGLAKGITAVGLLSAMMTIMIKSLKGAHNVKGAIMAMAISIGVMAASIVALSFIDTKSLFSAAGAMTIVMSAFALMIKSMKGLSRQKVPVKQIAAMIGVILALAGVVAILSLLDPKSAVTNAEALSLLLLALSSSLFIIGKAGNISNTVSKQLLIMALVVAGLATILVIMNALNAEGSISSAIAIGILLNSLASAVLILGFAGPTVSKAVPAAMMMGIVLAEIALVLGLMSAFDIKPSIETALALSTLILALSTACLIISRVPSAAAIDGAIGLAAFIGIMAGVITALGALSQIPGFTELLSDGGTALGLIGTAIGNFVGGILGGIITGVGTAIIDLIPKLGEALSDFMVGAQDFITIASTLDSSVVAGAGYMTAAILMLTAADFLAGIAQFLNGGLSFSDLGEQLRLFGEGAVRFVEVIKGVDSKAVEAAKNVADMILTLSLSELIDAITEFLAGEVDYADMGENLKTFGEAVVGFSDTVKGKIDTASVEAATNAGMMLAELNNSLDRKGGLLQDLLGETDFEDFAESCKAFAGAMIEINEKLSQEGFVIESEKIEQLVTAGEQFNELNTALPKSNGLVQKFLGTEELGKFGTACVAFTRAMIKVNKAVSQEGFVVQSDKIAQLATAGTKFNELNTALPKSNGIVQEFLGTEELGAFGTACKAFAKAMITVNEAVSQEGFAINLDAIEDLKQAGLKMNELQSVLPTSGGWWEAVAGSDADKLTTFGENITSFAKAMRKFSNAAAEMNADQIDIAMNAANRIKALVAELVELDTSGVGAFVGVSFGGANVDGVVHLIAEGMVAFSDKVADIDTEAVTVAVTEAQKLRKLIATLVGLDTSGIENFTPQAIADQMKGYADKVAGIDTLTVSSSISSAVKLKSFIAGLVGLDTSGIDKFKVDSIASSLKSYSTSLSGTNISAINASIVSANKVKAFVIGLSGLNTTGVTSFKNAIDQLSTVNIDALVNAFSGASTKMSLAGANMINGLINGMNSKMSLVKSVFNNIFSAFSSTIASKIQMFEKAGSTMATRLAAGFSSKKNAVSSAVSSCLDSAASKISDKYDSFYNAGSYLVTGFCNGIKDNSYKAAAKSKAMAEAAVQAAKEVLKINSPSRVFKEIGSGIPEGFSIGIGMLGGEVRKSVAGMASTAINTTRSAMNTVLNALNSDMDVQPTIRPVIDLSDVKTGARAIDGMFNGIQTIGVRSNLNAINSMMNAKLQNGTNDDIISAINKLNDGLENNRGDTYNFGDFTYDDGSNINDAVQTLVRAAKMGRRV